MWEYDGVANVARLGVLTPDFDPVPESELWAMAPRGVSVHTARVPRGGGRGAGFVTEGPIDAAVDRLVELSPRAILLGYTSSSYALGAKADEQVRNRLEQRAKGLPLIFTCAAANAALRKRGSSAWLSCIRPGGPTRPTPTGVPTGAPRASRCSSARGWNRCMPPSLR